MARPARLIMERIIGRPLKKGEVVHHINGNERDQRVENLMLFKSYSDHMRFEWGHVVVPLWAPPGEHHGGRLAELAEWRGQLHLDPSKYEYR